MTIGACAFQEESLRLQTYTRNMQYLLLFHCNIGYEEPECYVIIILPVLFHLYQ